MSLRWRGRGATLLSLGALGFGGCKDAPQGDPAGGTLVVWLESDLAIPKDIDGLGFQVNQGARLLAREARSVESGGLKLPLRFRVDGWKAKGDPIRLRAMGLLGNQPKVRVDYEVPVPGAGDGEVHVVLSSMCAHPTFVGPLDLQGWAQNRCGDGQTCRWGRCASWREEGAAVSTLPSEANDVTTAVSSCFDTLGCFQGELARKPLRDGERCILPPGGSESSRGRALAVVLRDSGQGTCDGQGQCYVPVSVGKGPASYHDEGGSLVLPSVACEADILGVALSARCPAKGAALPLCATTTNLPRDRAGEGSSGGHGPLPLEPSSEATPNRDGGLEPSPPSDGGLGPTGPFRRLRGRVQGLYGSEGLVLRLKDTETLAVGPTTEVFEFVAGLSDGSPFEVQVIATPFAMQCNVEGGRGLMGPETGPDNVLVQCGPEVPAKRLAGGLYHTCAALENGTVRCWGADWHGQLGGSSVATSIVGLTGVVDVGAGYEYSCALLKDETVRCWGYPDDGVVLDSSTAKSIGGLSGVVQLATGMHHACAVVRDGTARCWGRTGSGQAGEGDPSKPVPGLSGVLVMAAGGSHTCAVLRDRTLQCAGKNDWEQSAGGRWGVPIEGLSGLATVAAGELHTCVGFQNGTVRCWGWPNLGQLGGSDLHTSIQGLDGVVQLAGGNGATCAVRTDARVRCWGIVGKENNPFPMETNLTVPGVEDARQVVVATSHACALRKDGTVLCWGDDDFGQLGNFRGPTVVSRLDDVIDVSAGDAHTCALRRDGRAHCWGRRTPFVLGTMFSDSEIEDPVPGIEGATSISVGYEHSCALMSDGLVRCWGVNSFGELGTSGQQLPVTGLSGAVQVAAGHQYTCAVLKDGTVRCWGGHSSYLRGGATVDRPLPGLSDVVQVATGKDHACALTVSGQVYCWGVDHDPTVFGGSFDLRRLVGLPKAKQIAVGAAHACAILEEGTVRCWGDNTLAQTAGASIHGAIAGLTGVVEIRAGSFHTCARRQEGTVSCWGLGAGGAELGLRPSVLVPEVTKVLRLTGGGRHSCALSEGGALRCWGADSFGQCTAEPSPMTRVPLRF